MRIEITDQAKSQLKEVMTNSNFEEPAVRIVIAGMG